MINAVIGENIKKLREMTGFNQACIAGFLGVDQSLISKVEKGERALAADMLEKLACLFGVPVKAIESKDMSDFHLSIAFRGSELSREEMEAISVINKIALNSEFMAELLGDEDE